MVVFRWGKGGEEGELAMLSMNGWMDGHNERVNVGGLGLEEGEMMPGRGGSIGWCLDGGWEGGEEEGEAREERRGCVFTVLNIDK